MLLAIIMAIAIAFGPAVELVSGPNVTRGVITSLAVFMGAGLGLLFSAFNKDAARVP